MEHGEDVYEMNGIEKCPHCNVDMKVVKRVNTREGWVDYLIWKCPQCKKCFKDAPTLEEVPCI